MITVPMITLSNATITFNFTVQAQNCEHFGCSAMVIFSDPADVAAEGTEPEDVYPNTFWLPPTGMQRGSLLLSDGDPQTPNYPSIDGVFRTDIEELKKTVFPKIPCQPVSIFIR